jgi:hypothetical protein
VPDARTAPSAKSDSNRIIHGDGPCVSREAEMGVAVVIGIIESYALKGRSLARWERFVKHFLQGESEHEEKKDRDLDLQI